MKEKSSRNKKEMKQKKNGRWAKFTKKMMGEVVK